MTVTNPCFDDVLSTHILIRDWLSGTAAVDKCDELLARFSPGFTMVAPGGMRLDHAGLTQFFRAAGGSRPGLAMRITDLQLIQESATGATVSYREFQSLPGADNTERWSTVVYEKTPDGALLWRHLHETWAARAD